MECKVVILCIIVAHPRHHQISRKAVYLRCILRSLLLMVQLLYFKAPTAAMMAGIWTKLHELLGAD